MNAKVILCADTESLARPGLLGLDDVDLEHLDWLIPVSDALEVRHLSLGHADIGSVWVVSNDDMEAINLAAALRKDRPDREILLILFETSGSALSRAQSAGVSEVLTYGDFCKRFAAELVRRKRMKEIEHLDLKSGEERPAPSASSNALGERSAGSFKSASSPQDQMHLQAPSDTGSISQACTIITVLSGSGGAGKSTITALASFLCAGFGKRVLALDADLQFGDLHRLMGPVSTLSIDDALEDPGQLSNLSEHAADGRPALLAAPRRLERFEAIAQHLDELVRTCSAHFDIIFVNTGASWAEYHASLLETSDTSLFIVDQRASSVRACQHALDLCMRMGIASGSFAYALNRCKRGAMFTNIDIAAAMQGVHVMELKDGGSEVEELLGAGLAEELIADKNVLCASLEALLEEILPQATSAHGDRRGSAQVLRGGKEEASASAKPRRPRRKWLRESKRERDAALAMHLDAQRQGHRAYGQARS